MNDNHIEIKERRSSLLAKGIIFLFLSLISLIIALLPYIVISLRDNSLVFYLSGGISFAFFATMFVFLLVKECKPDNALILNLHGFTDRKNIGENIEIEWTNVASVKLMGKKEMPYLGITLENADLVMVHMKKSLVDEMRENIEEGLPHILISQKEIRYPINELKDLFVKFTREARALKNDAPVKPKNNPFTTEDVLRAFGKLDEVKPVERNLPEDDVRVFEATHTNSDNTETKTDEDNFIPPIVDIIEQEGANFEKDSQIEPTDNISEVIEKSNDNKEEIKSVDSFYELLIRQAESVQSKEGAIESTNDPLDNECSNVSVIDVIAQTPCEEVNINNDLCDTTEKVDENELSDEMIQLISKAKSSKIAELEKILNEKDVPFSAMRSNSIADDSKNDISEEPTETVEDPKPVAETSASVEDKKKPDSMGDTKEFYPEIVRFDDIIG